MSSGKSLHGVGVKSLSFWSKNLLIFAVAGLLAAPALFPTEEPGNKALRAYWAETTLSPRTLMNWVNDEECWTTEKAFFGCVNSLRLMGRWRKATLTIDGRWIINVSAGKTMLATEKEELAKWEGSFAKSFRAFSFNGLLAQLWADANWAEPLADADRKLMLGAGLNGFLSITKDPHTYVIPKAYYEEVVAQHQARAATFGFVSKIKAGRMSVRKILESSPAQVAGLRRGDQILQINGVAIEEYYPHELQDWSRFTAHGRVELLVARGNERRSIEILSSPELVSGSETRMLAKGLGLLTIHKFAARTCGFVRDQLRALVKEGITGLLLDLRDNPGGHMEEAICVAGLFLKEGTPVLESRYLDPALGSEKYVSREPRAVFTGPLAVLINSGSASAAEIVAGALRDVGRARLVGERTFGKGSFQDGRVWEYDESMIMFQTEGIYYFPSGWTPQLVGIEPDIAIRGELEEVSREKDLFVAAIRPMDEWVGPQANFSLIPERCRDPRVRLDDRQAERAAEWLRCSAANAN